MTTNPEVQRIAEAIRSRQRFVLSSHSRPDGDSIGSQLAMAYALRAMGKHADVVNADPAPPPIMQFPGVPDIGIAPQVEGAYDAAIIMECGDLGRTGVAGLDRYFVINIDHHQGNTRYGTINWLDESAAACGELVFSLVVKLGVPLTLEIATHIYLAILTDTGSFHYSGITPYTFDICRQCVEAGVNPAAMARRVFDSNSFGKLKLIGALLDHMDLVDDGRLAVLHLDDQILNQTGTTYNDTEGVINLPLTAREIQAVAFFKAGADGDVRVSLRSKYDVDVRAVASRHGGGGHKNAAGFTLRGPLADVQPAVIAEIREAIAAGMKTRPQ